MNVAADACGNRYMLEPSLIPPHITVCYFMADNQDSVVNIIDEKAKTLGAGKITWSSLGAFDKFMLFAAPVLNEYLFNVSSELNAYKYNIFQPIKTRYAHG